MPGPDEVVYDLVDVVEEGDPEGAASPRKAKVAVVTPNLKEEIAAKVTEVTERVAREMIPDIVERILREEIEKLKAR